MNIKVSYFSFNLFYFLHGIGSILWLILSSNLHAKLARTKTFCASVYRAIDLLEWTKYRMFKNIGLLVFLNLIISNAVFAQYPLLRQYTTKEGLASIFTTSLIQDKEGFIWISTGNGVNRFDGKKFQTFSVEDGLSDNAITALREDSKGRIWFFGSNGSVSYWYKDKIYNQNSDTILKKIKDRFFFYDLFEDREGKIWFKSITGYSILDKGKVYRTEHEFNNNTSLVFNGKSGQIILMPEEPFCARYDSLGIYPIKLRFKILNYGYWRFKDESVLFAAREGIVWQKDTIQKLILPAKGLFEKMDYCFMSLAKDSILWISSQGQGLYCFNLKDPLAEPVIYFKNKVISYVFEDNEGNIWFNLQNDGLYMIPGAAKKTIVYNEKNILINNQCGVHKRDNGDLIVVNKGNLLNRISNHKSYKLDIPEITDEPTKEVTGILSRKDDIWIGTYSGLFHQNKTTGCSHFIMYKDSANSPVKRTNAIFDLTLGRDKIYFINHSKILEYPINCKGNSTHCANVIQRENTWIFSIYLDRSNRIWYGTKSGLHSLKNTEHFDHTKENILFCKRVNSIGETEDSVMVFATHGFGIIFYKNGKIINNITKANGLSNNNCGKISIHKNRIYVSTPDGVSVLNYSKGKVLSFQYLNTGNYLPSNDVNDVYIDDMDITVATMEGLAIIQHASLDNIKPPIPFLKITEVKVMDSILSLEGGTVLTHNKNSLKINFIGINFQQPEEVNYRYRLKNNKPWETTNNTEIEFASLQPGKYIFQLQARVRDGDWSPIKSFAFTITPPFWKTWWFILIIILISLFLIAMATLYRIKQINKRNKMKLYTITAELQALRSQMNPHFVFNALNSIQDFVLNNQKKEASIYLSDFALLMRMTLENAQREHLPLSEELVFLTKYVEMEQLRFDNLFQFRVEVGEAINTSECEFPSMLLQPFIENAIQHGLNGRQNGILLLSFYKKATDLFCIIEDNGCGREKANLQKHSGHKSAAMEIIRLRIDKYNSEGSFKIVMTIDDLTDATGLPSGTKITLNFSGYFS